MVCVTRHVPLDRETTLELELASPTHPSRSSSSARTRRSMTSGLEPYAIDARSASLARSREDARFDDGPASVRAREREHELKNKNWARHRVTRRPMPRAVSRRGMLARLTLVVLVALVARANANSLNAEALYRSNVLSAAAAPWGDSTTLDGTRTARGARIGTNARWGRRRGRR